MLTRRQTIVAIVAGSLLSRPQPAPAASRVALLVVPGDQATQDDVERFTTQVEHEILQHPGYTLVSRTRINEVLEEQGFANRGYADPKTAAQLGKILGATDILHVELTFNVSQTSGAFVTSREVDASGDFELIDVTTAQIKNADTAEGSDSAQATTGAPLKAISLMRRVALDSCADDLVDKFIKP